MVMRATSGEVAAGYGQMAAGDRRVLQKWRDRVDQEARVDPQFGLAMAAVMRGELSVEQALQRFRLANPGTLGNLVKSWDEGVRDLADRAGVYDQLATEWASRPETATPATPTETEGPRFQLRDTPDGPVIYDSKGGASYTPGMATQEMLDAVGLGVGGGGDRTSTRPANAATLPGFAAPARVGGVQQSNVFGNPTAGERAGGIVSTIPGFDRPPAPAGAGAGQPGYNPTPTPTFSRPGPIGAGAGAGASFALPRMGMPRNVDYAGSASSIFGAYAGAPGGGFAPPGAGAGAGAAPASDVERYSALSALSARPRVEADPTAGEPLPPGEGEGEPIPPDPGGGAVWNPETRQWELPPPLSSAPSPSGGGGGGGGTGPVGGHWEKPPLVWDPGEGTWKQGDPIWVADRAPERPPQRAPQYPSEAARDYAQIDQILASAGLTQVQAERIKALLPGELDIQKASVAQIYAAIDNAARTLNLNIDRYRLDKAVSEAQLLGKYGDQYTMDYIRTMGFAPGDVPTLDTRKFQHQQALDYANSARQDMLANLQRSGQMGYDEYGNPTLQREQLVSSEERANLLAQAQMGNLAAQIRLREIDQAEARRQFDTRTEMEWRQNPSSVFDRVWESRGGSGGGGAAGGGGFAAPTPSPAAAMAVQAPAPAPAQPQMSMNALPETATATAAAPGFAPPAPVAAAVAPQQQQQQPAYPGAAQSSAFAGPGRRALTYGEIQRAGVEPPGIAAATRGDREMPRWRPAGEMPMVSGQALNRLSPTERSVFDAQLRATGNDPADYEWNRRRLTGPAVRTSGGFSAPRRAGAF